MSSYLQQIALRSSDETARDAGGPALLTPLQNPFDARPLTESREEWPERMVTSGDEIPEYRQETRTPPSAAAPEEETAGTKMATKGTTYLGTRLQRTLTPTQEILKETREHKSVVKEKTTVVQTPSVLPVAEKKETVVLPAGEQAVTNRLGTVYHRQPVEPAIKSEPFVLPVYKGNQPVNEYRGRHYLEPAEPVILPNPKKASVEKKLTIGRLTVEIILPAVQAKERVAVRSYEAPRKTERTDVNKLIFGLGQL